MAPRRMKERALPALQQRAVDEFWRRQQEDIEATVDFSEHLLPMARIKSILRDKQDDMMISADTPAFVTKLTELFIQELAVRAWACAQSHQRRIILDTDIAEAVASTKSYAFLDGLVARYFEAQRGAGGHASSTPPGRLITRKRHTPAPDPAFPSRHFHHPQVQYINNHVTSDFVFFTNDGTMNYNNFVNHPFAFNNNYSAAATVLQNTVINTDPDVATEKFMEKTTVNYCGKTDGNAARVNGGRHGSMEVKKQDGAAAAAGGNKPSMYMYMDEILMDEQDMLYLDDEFDMASTPPALEDFIGDQGDLDDGAFSHPGSSGGSSCN